MSIYFSYIVKKEVILTIEVIEETKFKRIFYCELWCGGFAFLKGHVVSLLHNFTWIFIENCCDEVCELWLVGKFINIVGEISDIGLHFSQTSCWYCACMTQHNWDLDWLTIYFEPYFCICDHFVECFELTLEILRKNDDAW